MFVVGEELACGVGVGGGGWGGWVGVRDRGGLSGGGVGTVALKVKEIAEIIDDNKISQDVVVENVQNALSQEDGEPQSVNEAEHSLETGSTRDETINKRTVSQVSEIEALPKTKPYVSATRTKVSSSPAHGVGVNESNRKQRISALLLNKKSDVGASDVDHHLRGRPPRNARRFADRGSNVEQRDPCDIHGRKEFDLRDILKKLKVKLVANSCVNQHHYGARCEKSERAREVKILLLNFDRLRMRCAMEEEVIARFLGALQADIADVGLPKQLVIIMDDEAPVYDTENEDDMVKETDELVYADQGEALVTQRVLNADVVKTGDDSSWLRNNIFCTKCTTKGKVCTIIIDGGSCDNMVAISMVEKLSLDVEDHAESYQLTWLKKGKRRQGITTSLLALMRDIQHCIDFLPGSTIPNKYTYRMNPKEFDELHKQVTELLNKGLICESISPCAIPTLLVPKHGGTFRMCIDSRAVNKITVKYRFPIPRFDDLIDQLHSATIFLKIDLRSGYHQIRMRPGDEWKTAFKTRDGLYEWMVMPFGLSNAPSTFMRLMNHVFKPFIGCFVVVYFDDILVFSKDTAQHLSHLQQVFCVLREQKLYANETKCHFLATEVVFLGYLVSGEGIRMDTTKVEVIRSWLTPTMIHDIRSFHGLASFYRRFIGNFSSIIAPMIECMKGGKFKWTVEAD
ncbi:RNA-directed DNA polymerase, partial [Tanacetum coccineum]